MKNEKLLKDANFFQKGKRMFPRAKLRRLHNMPTQDLIAETDMLTLLANIANGVLLRVANHSQANEPLPHMAFRVAAEYAPHKFELVARLEKHYFPQAHIVCVTDAAGAFDIVIDLLLTLVGET